MKKIYLPIIILLIIACSANLPDKETYLLTSELPVDEYVKESGKKLIQQPFGFTQIIADSSEFDNILVIAVHGYVSRGYEWIAPLNKLSDKYTHTYFYRYDWDLCPDLAGNNFADSLAIFLQNQTDFAKIVIFGHSYGGLVITNLIDKLDFKIPAEFHTIAAPLAGYQRIAELCDLQYDEDGILTYPSWNSDVEHFQWRTQKEQDGAYRDMEYDPQEISLTNSNVTVLPAIMDGHRLGHNWSVTWVINNYLESLSAE